MILVNDLPALAVETERVASSTIIEKRINGKMVDVGVGGFCKETREEYKNFPLIL